MKEVVHNNLKRTSKHQKTWYDQNSREWSFVQDDQVLVLLPTSASKLSVQWQGPYRVIERIGRVNYRVLMEDRKKKLRVFHVNMLSKWHPPETGNEEIEIDIPAWNDTDGVRLSWGTS